MKISYYALCKEMTVHELFLKTIFKTYNIRNRQGLVKKPYIYDEDKFYKLVLMGKADLKLVVWHRAVAKGLLKGTEERTNEKDKADEE
jgi:hypothetical protein